MSFWGKGSKHQQWKKFGGGGVTPQSKNPFDKRIACVVDSLQFATKGKCDGCPCLLSNEKGSRNFEFPGLVTLPVWGGVKKVFPTQCQIPSGREIVPAH